MWNFKQNGKTRTRKVSRPSRHVWTLTSNFSTLYRSACSSLLMLFRHTQTSNWGVLSDCFRVQQSVNEALNRERQFLSQQIERSINSLVCNVAVAFYLSTSALLFGDSCTCHGGPTRTWSVYEVDGWFEQWYLSPGYKPSVNKGMLSANLWRNYLFVS